MQNLVGWPQPVCWPLAGFGANTMAASEISLVLYVLPELELTFYV